MHFCVQLADQATIWPKNEVPSWSLVAVACWNTVLKDNAIQTVFARYSSKLISCRSFSAKHVLQIWWKFIDGFGYMHTIKLNIESAQTEQCTTITSALGSGVKN